MKNIIIFGGGTSGWLSAAYLVNNLKSGINITLIEDSSLGPIGVGEGTQPSTARFLYECGIDSHHWMKPSNATFKYGVELVGWNENPYFIDNDNFLNSKATDYLCVNKYFANKPYSEYKKWHPAYRLAKENKSSKLAQDLDNNFNIWPGDYGAVHFSAYDIIETIKNLILNKITYIDTKIIKVNQNIEGVSGLVDEKNNEYTADLYIDCSGFKSILLGETLGVEFINYKPWLLNDRAVAIPTQYTNPEVECHPYTKATAMKAGWRWTIPIYNRVGNGYVYSSDFSSPEEAEKELRESINEWDAPAKHLNMRCGSHKKIAVKNVVGVGLAAGFVEPLEATGISFTTGTIRTFCDIFNHSGVWNEKTKDTLNNWFEELTMETLSFVFVHYYFSNKSDTPYWKEVHNKKISDLPLLAQEILADHYPIPNNNLLPRQYSNFTSLHWWGIIHAGNKYDSKDTELSLSEEEEKYLKYFIDTQNFRVNSLTEIFPNHYKFLNSWYAQ